MPDMSIQTVEAATARLEQFALALGPHFEESHYVLACHAAFPAFVTPDLLHQIWKNFKSWPDERGKMHNIPLLAVSDVLLSALFRPTGTDLYEMEPGVSTLLTQRLAADPRFGPARIRELASFLYQYAESQPDRPEFRHLREAQQWTALMAVNPAVATQEMLKTLAEKAGGHQVNRSLSIMNLMEGFALGTEGVGEALAVYLKPVEKGTIYLPAYVGERLKSITNSQQIPAPEYTTEESSQTGIIRAILFGISRYEHPGLTPLPHATADVRRMESFLNSIPDQAVCTCLTGDSVASGAIKEIIQSELQAAQKGDTVLIYFAGHSTELHESRSHGLVLQDFSTDKKGEVQSDVLEMEDFRRLIVEHKRPDTQVTLLLDSDYAGTGWLPVGPDYTLMMACHPLEHASETNRGGIFTQALIQSYQDGKKTIKSVFADMLRYSYTILVEPGQTQTPLLIKSHQDQYQQFLRKNDLHQSILSRLIGQSGYLDLPPSTFYSDHLIDHEEDALPYLSIKQRIKEDGRLQIVLFLDVSNESFTRSIVHQLEPCGELKIYPIQELRHMLRQLSTFHVVIVSIDDPYIQYHNNSSLTYHQLLRSCQAFDQIIICLQFNFKPKDEASELYEAWYPLFDMPPEYESTVPDVRKITTLDELNKLALQLQALTRHRTPAPVEPVSVKLPNSSIPVQQRVSQEAPDSQQPPKKKSFWRNLLDLRNVWPFSSTTPAQAPTPESDSPAPTPKKTYPTPKAASKKAAPKKAAQQKPRPKK